MAAKKPPKGKPAAKAKGKGKGKDGAEPKVGAHPRAALQIRKAKGWGGLVAFLLVFVLSLQAGAPVFDALWRALLAGIVGLMVAWAAAVVAWRHLIGAEARAAQRAAIAAAEARQTEAAGQ